MTYLTEQVTQLSTSSLDLPRGLLTSRKSLKAREGIVLYRVHTFGVLQLVCQVKRHLPFSHGCEKEVPERPGGLALMPGNKIKRQRVLYSSLMSGVLLHKICSVLISMATCSRTLCISQIPTSLRPLFQWSWAQLFGCSSKIKCSSFSDCSFKPPSLENALCPWREEWVDEGVRE